MKKNILYIACTIVFILNIVTSKHAAAENPPLVLAIINPDIGTPKTVKTSFKPLIKWLSNKSNRSINIIIIPDSETTIKELKAGKIDIGYTGVVDFFRIQNKFPVKPGITFVRGEKNYYTSCFIVRKKDKDLPLDSFKGKKYGFTSFHKTFGGLYPQIFLHENKFSKSLDDFFSSVKSYYSDAEGIIDLLKGKIDVCVASLHTINTLKQTAPHLVKNLHIYHQLEGLMFSLIFYRDQVDDELKDTLVNESIAFGETIEGKQLLMMFKLDGIKAVTNKDYEADRQRAVKLGLIPK